MTLLQMPEDRLAECERRIEQGLKTFIDVGKALIEIRDDRLYRDTHATFEDYCRQRWGMRESRAYQMMDAAQAVEVLKSSTIVELPLPTNEAQARPLTILRGDPDAQREAWQEVTIRAAEREAPVTAALVQEVVSERVRQGGVPTPPQPAAPRSLVDLLTDQEKHLWADLKVGYTVVVNIKEHANLVLLAQSQDLYVRCDRQSIWGNPFIMGPDGDRDTVCDSYGQFYLPRKPSLLSQLGALDGKALGCWCAPLRCHCDELIKALEERGRKR